MPDRPWHLHRSDNERRILAARVVASQRRDPYLGLQAAAAQEGIDPDWVLWFFGNHYWWGTDGDWHPQAYDNEPFLMNVYSTRGIVEVIAPDSDARTLIGRHTSAVWRFRDTGDASDLGAFTGKQVAGVTLETDPDRLLSMVWTGPDFLEIYNP